MRRPLRRTPRRPRGSRRRALRRTRCRKMRGGNVYGFEPSSGPLTDMFTRVGSSSLGGFFYHP